MDGGLVEDERLSGTKQGNTLPMRVAVGMSGGADSSLAAHLLRERGHAVTGITLRLWPLPSSRSSEAHVMRARWVAERLGIVHEVVDLTSAFEHGIVRPFVASYASGRTPSPCVRCNALVKFGLLADAARERGCSVVATGHYVRRVGLGDGTVALLRGCDPRKDQSYFLAALHPEQVAAARFPLGCLTKDRVRTLAAALDLVPHGQRESQDLCFVPDGDYASFLEARCPDLACPGPIVSVGGEVLGEHDGIHRFTVGQRRGLGLGGGPWYVVAIDAAEHRLVVGGADDLEARAVHLSGVSWLQPPPAAGTVVDCEAQVRYAMRPQPVAVDVRGGGRAVVRFPRGVRAATPGQFTAFYAGERVLGGGWIERTE